jgi:1-aminocyclopropane-1-carboxylate deaminase/D-cysteine desulfhydrase-like pyridoxal-dependent ACC family enzyme
MSTKAAMPEALRPFADVPRHSLIGAPTPLIEQDRLAKAIGGPGLWFKRDDLIPFGFGGNKVRGLEFLLADALAKGADTLVTGAGSLSNHVRASAATARAGGLDMVAVYWGNPPEEIQGNFRLVQMLGAQTRFTRDMDRSSVDSTLDAVEAELREAGRTPYVIPRGGACPLGVVGHVHAVAEFAAQCKEKGLTPDLVVLAVGSGATLAGWLLGSRLIGAPWQIEGYTVSRPAEEARDRAAMFARDAATLVGLSHDISAAEITIHDGFIGEGYGKASPAGNAAITATARACGVFLDPVYTGKAFAGFMHHVDAGRFKDVSNAVFLHSGGEPSLFVGQGALA